MMNPKVDSPPSGDHGEDLATKRETDKGDAGGVAEIGSAGQGQASQDWHRVVNDPLKDVLLIAHRNDPKDCQANTACALLTAYVKGVAKRFHALGITTVQVASINAQKVALPHSAHLSLASLPGIFLIPVSH